jgi:hypothetical protein
MLDVGNPNPNPIDLLFKCLTRVGWQYYNNHGGAWEQLLSPWGLKILFEDHPRRGRGFAIMAPKRMNINVSGCECIREREREREYVGKYTTLA